jgi:hypothetical protein
MNNKRYEFNEIERYCKTCGVRLVLKAMIHIERKKYCSKECQFESVKKKGITKVIDRSSNLFMFLHAKRNIKT